MSIELAILPVMGFLLVLAGLLWGLFFSRFLHASDKTKATFHIGASLANHGATMGGFLCYLFLGETGLGLAFIFTIYFSFYVYLVIFSYAQIVSHQTKIKMRDFPGFIFKLHNLPLFALITAITIRATGYERPDIHLPVFYILICSVALAYFALGITFEFKSIAHFKKENMLITGIKFILIPLTACILVGFIPIPDSYRYIVVIESFMPVAVYTVVTSVLFNLDTKFATALFVVNTLIFFFIIMPLLFTAYHFIR